MSTSPTSQLTALLGPVVSAAGLDLETLDVTPAGRRRVVRVVVDADGGVSLDAVAEVSRLISDVLDDSDVLGNAPFVLEVSSPGVDRPLSEPRHWRRAVGRLVTVTIREGSSPIGRLLEAGDDGLVLEVSGAPLTIAWPSVVRGRVEVEFTRPGAADDGPDDDGAGDGRQG